MKTIDFKIERNSNGSYAIIENPDSGRDGISPLSGDRVVRSPFSSPEEARQKAHSIAEFDGYALREVDTESVAA